MCKFGHDLAIYLVEEVNCGKCLQMDRQTDDGCRTIVLAHRNELKIKPNIWFLDHSVHELYSHSMLFSILTETSLDGI